MTDAVAEQVREIAAYWIISPQAQPKHVHVPSDDSTRADPDPMCLTGTGNGVTTAADWVAKEVAQLPPGWYDQCERCHTKLRQQNKL